MNEIAQGWLLSGVGLLVAFLFMSIFIVVIWALKRSFPYREERAEEAVSAAPAVMEVPAAVRQDDEVAAAIGLALAWARAHETTGLGDSLAQGRGAWWSANRLAAGLDVDLVRR